MSRTLGRPGVALPAIPLSQFVVGLVVPHAMRRVVGPGHGALLAASAVGGAFLLVAGDTLVRVTSGYFNLPVVPVGVFTAFIGAPYFLVIMRRKAL